MPTVYTATLELRAPGALPLRVDLPEATPRVVVTARALSTWLTAREALGKRPLAAVIAAQGAALSATAQGDAGVLTPDEAVMVVAAVGGAAVRLLPELMAAMRDGEAAAAKALRGLLSRVRAATAQNPGTLLAAVPAAAAPPQNLSEHMAAERAAMVEALEATRWDRGAAAERLGMSRRTFYRRMTEYGLLEGAKPRGIKAQRLRREAAAQLAKGGGRQK